MKGRVIACVEYGKPFEIQEYDVPEPAPGAVLLRSQSAKQMLSCWTASNGLHHCTSLSGIRGQSKPKITTNSESGAGTTWICKGPWVRK